MTFRRTISICLQTRYCKVTKFCCGVVKNAFNHVIYPVKCITSRTNLCTAHLRYWLKGIALMYVLTFFVILPPLFYNVNNSVFFIQRNRTAYHEHLKTENSQRVEAAEKYMLALQTSEHSRQISNSSRGVHIALTIITVSRNRNDKKNTRNKTYKPKYLTQTITKFHSLLARWDQDKHGVYIFMSICNVDHDLASYHEANDLSKFVHTFTRFNHTHHAKYHILEKEKQDYVFCLNQSLEVNRKADYVFLVEDDAYPNNDVFGVLKNILTMHTEQLYSRGEFHAKRSNIAFIKFYHPDRLLSFISLETERLPELLSYSALMSTLLTIVYTVGRRFANEDNNISTDTLWIVLFKFSILVMLACGRVQMSKWRRLASPYLYSFTPAPSCCTPAMLFPRSAVQTVVNYLNNTECRNNFGKDSALDKMLKDMHMAAYLVQPNTFVHIGAHSSLRSAEVNPFKV